MRPLASRQIDKSRGQPYDRGGQSQQVAGLIQFWLLMRLCDEPIPQCVTDK